MVFMSTVPAAGLAPGSAHQKILQLGLPHDSANQWNDIGVLEIDIMPFEILFEPHHESDARAVHEGHA
jgi:hypothetical protein